MFIIRGFFAEFSFLEKHLCVHQCSNIVYVQFFSRVESPSCHRSSTLLLSKPLFFLYALPPAPSTSSQHLPPSSTFLHSSDTCLMKARKGGRGGWEGREEDGSGGLGGWGGGDAFSDGGGNRSDERGRGDG
jgi:hypothetical protein